MTTDSRRRTTVIAVSVTAIGIVFAAIAIVGFSSRGTGTGLDTSSPNSSPSAGASAGSATTSPAPSGPVPFVRDNSHVLGDPADGSVTMVEFLDFECEACGALYPLYEEIRKQYAGKVRFVTRYFPIPSHFNAMNAAVAVEAAAQQGSFEEMYQIMFGTQSTWGEAQESKAELFRTFAQELGLDMAKYDATVADPATVARVEQDRNDGQALGVQGTPTLFLNGTKLELSSAQQLTDDIDAAIASS